MWPATLNTTTTTSKVECKKMLRALELDAYAALITAFRAQGDLSARKVSVLAELQLLLRISVDRHKAELRRAANDERLCSIAKRLSCVDCISTEWTRQAKRMIPLLPTLDATDSDCRYYRVLADHVLAKASSVLSLYPDAAAAESRPTDAELPPDEPSLAGPTEPDLEDDDFMGRRLSKKLKKKIRAEREELMHASNAELDNDLDKAIRPIDDERDLIFLKNGYAVESRYVKVENLSPREYMKKFEATNETDDNRNSFIKFLLEKYKKQQLEKENEASKFKNHQIQLNQAQHQSNHQNHHHHNYLSNMYSSSQLANKKLNEASNFNLPTNNRPYHKSTANLIHHDAAAAAAAASSLDTSSAHQDLILNHHHNQQQQQQQQQHQQNHNNENKPLLTSKNSLKISQIIDTMSQQANHYSAKMLQHQSPQINPVRMSSTQSQPQMIKLNSSLASAASALNSANASNSSTIVKLTPTPANPSQTSQPAPAQIKHLVLPKSNQKLIILPQGSGGGGGGGVSSLNSAVLDSSSSSSSSSSSTTPIAGITSPGIMSKLVLYKTSKPSAIETENGAEAAPKNPKIIGAPSILTMQQPKPPVLFNVNTNLTNSINLKPIKIIESGVNSSDLHQPLDSSSSVKRKFQLSNDHLFAPAAASSLSSSSSNNAEETNGGSGSSKLSFINMLKSNITSGAGSNNSASGPNLVCLKLEKLDGHSLENGAFNGKNDESEATTKRIKLIDVADFNDTDQK